MLSCLSLERVVILFISQATSPVTVQQAQTNALLSMLNLNTPVEPSASVVSASGKAAPGLKVTAASGPPVWKILVLDQETKDILATVLRVQDLREIGVTLHVYVFPFLPAWLVSVTIFDAKATPLVSTTTVRRPCHLLRCSYPRKYQENCTRPPERTL